MKKLFSILLATSLVLGLLCFAGCGESEEASDNTTASESKEEFVIAVPNDTTNEARALLLLESLGYIKLKEGAGITATALDVVENPYNFKFQEVEAATIPNIRNDVDFAIINSNYAIDAGIDPTTEALAQEGSESAYANILSVKEGREKDPIILALFAALSSQKVADFILESYNGAVVSVVDKPTDGYDANIDYASLAGQTIKVAASPTPHAQILEIAKELLAAKQITLEIVEFTDYVQPNNVVEEGELDANYFQHVPYMDDFNAENGTHIVSVGPIHVEPLGIYGGKQTTLDVIK